MDYLNLIILISKKIEIEFSLTQSKKFRTRIFTYVFRTMKFQIAFVAVLSLAFLLSEGIKICLNQYENIFQEFSGFVKARKQARGLDLTKKMDGDLSKINSGHYARVFSSVMKEHYDPGKLLPYLRRFLDRDGVDPNFVITDLEDGDYKGLNLVHALVWRGSKISPEPKSCSDQILDQASRRRKIQSNYNTKITGAKREAFVQCLNFAGDLRSCISAELMRRLVCGWCPSFGPTPK